MKIQTFSIVAGSEACNASCPFCMSKMTVPNGVPEGKAPKINEHRFKIACNLAKSCGVTTAMFTGKGEPTLFPDQIDNYLSVMQAYNFPIVELQSNGIPIYNRLTSERGAVRGAEKNRLLSWKEKGLIMIALSIVGIDQELNRKIYLPNQKEYIDLSKLVNMLHDLDFSVRLACVMIKGGIDNPARLRELLTWSKSHNVEQLTIRPVNKPDPKQNRDNNTFGWVSGNYVDRNSVDEIVNYMAANGTKLMTLQHGAEIYDLHGQNVCLTDCLTRSPENDDLRQLIYFPTGRIGYDWQYEGAILV